MEYVNLLRRDLSEQTRNSSAHLILFQDVMMTDINEDDQSIALIVPNDADIHIDAALEQPLRPLDPLRPQ